MAATAALSSAAAAAAAASDEDAAASGSGEARLEAAARGTWPAYGRGCGSSTSITPVSQLITAPVAIRMLWWPQSPPGPGPSLTALASRFQPLLFSLADLLAGSPRDLLGLVCLASRSITSEMEGKMDQLWSEMYARRWPVFHEYLQFQKSGRQDWRQLYRETLTGRLQFLLEVFEREKMPGFTMAAMSAWVTYAGGPGASWIKHPAGSDGFVAQYISASQVPSEYIPNSEARRLRFCPSSAREQLRPGSGVDAEGLVSEAAYPYRVLTGFDGLVVGQGVELQWKMQMGSPFGWWFGKLESLCILEDGKEAIAEITFGHFPRTARWHRLEVRFGDGDMRFCAFGGYSGGLRPVTAEQERHWMHFHPRGPVAS